MLAPHLFEKIGYLPAWEATFDALYPKLQDGLMPLAEKIVSESFPVEDAQAMLAVRYPSYPVETLCLMLLFEASGYLYDRYRTMGLSEEMFYDAMRDLTCKTRECERLKNTFGTFVGRWYNGFFHMTRFAFGRLQFDVSAFSGDPMTLAGVYIPRGAFALQCHIPSLGPLTEEVCEASFLRARRFFAERCSEMPLIVTCRSYLLFPSYLPLFSESAPNIRRFASRFFISAVKPQKEFSDAWRIFYQNDAILPENLPADTSLQRAFIRYLKKEKYFGEGVGVALYQNGKIVTKNQYA